MQQAQVSLSHALHILLLSALAVVGALAAPAGAVGLTLHTEGSPLLMLRFSPEATDLPGHPEDMPDLLSDPQSGVLQIMSDRLGGPISVFPLISNRLSKEEREALPKDDVNRLLNAFVVLEYSSGEKALAALERLEKDPSVIWVRQSEWSGPPSSGAETAVRVIEYYNEALDHYFITTSVDEQLALDTGVHQGWSRTGETFLSAPATAADSRQVCRLYGLPSAGLDSHFYSADAAECSSALARWPESWVLETDEAFRSFLPDPATGACANGQQPVYRLFNGQADVNHRYTTSAEVKAGMVAQGWIPEGYGPQAVSMCAPL